MKILHISLPLLLSFFAAFINTNAQDLTDRDWMDNKKMGALLRSNSAEVKGIPGQWECYVANRTVFVITDDAHNRMRIISPVIEHDELSDEQLTLLLEANFDRALDAKYSVFNGLVWASYTHPLKELTDQQLVDALHQVVNLVNNFGTTFSSTDLVFGGEPK